MNEQVALEKSRLMKSIRHFMWVVSVLFIFLILLAYQWYRVAGNIDAEMHTISITGMAEEFVVPDIANVSFTIREEAKTVAAAQELATAKNNDVMDFLEDAGVEERDIKTTSYRVNPKYEYYYENNGVRCLSNYCPPPYVRKQEIIGYEVYQSTTVKVRDLDDAGEILNGLGSREVQNVSGPHFDIENREQLIEDIKNEAIKDARQKAKDRATALGVKLGKVVSVNDGSYGGGYYARSYGMDMAMEEMAVSASAPKVMPAPEISAGEDEIRAQVTVVFEIK